MQNVYIVSENDQRAALWSLMGKKLPITFAYEAIIPRTYYASPHTCAFAVSSAILVVVQKFAANAGDVDV